MSRRSTPGSAGFAPFTALDLRASSAWTRERLQWQPVGPGLLEDLRNMDYQKVNVVTISERNPLFNFLTGPPSARQSLCFLPLY
ncbi:nucleoside-diphosphate-sugar epimerase [Klebsiella variicola]|nr:nucleoside-diphosphate-sugar epimerase [Klebsiella variicola]